MERAKSAGSFLIPEDVWICGSRLKAGRRFWQGCRCLTTPLLRRMNRGCPGSASNAFTRRVTLDCMAFTGAVKRS